ncbi:MAG: acetate--CoA ligase family protein, partial [Acidobacteria bacterium]|nr:acetate--CoA ligase family protein [Acidobacteriota bacterium]
MKIHEYQAKEILSRYGVTTPKGHVADTPEEARRICEELGGKCVVKAQIHAGGRGKGGGVKLANSPQEAEEKARQILGMQLVTPQTGSEGQKVLKVLIAEQQDIVSELYVAVLLDRALGKPIVMASAAGGMDIEEVAAETPEKIFTVHVHPAAGLQGYQCRRLGFGLDLNKSQQAQLAKVLQALVRLMHECDASLVEINPLIVTGEGNIVAL